jgi:rhodanese-related sulfurtransferase
MNAREKISAVLVCLGIILALLPLKANRSFDSRPSRLMKEALDSSASLSPDQVAKMIASEDPSLQLIDLRPAEQFNAMSIPGSVNVPYSKFLDSDPDGILNNRKMKYVFYSNGDLESNYALMIARGLRYKNTFVMKGGLNEWFRVIMNTSFSGERITARENALFENRMNARRMFTAVNSLPDSLKIKFIESKRIGARKLDGGCE